MLLDDQRVNFIICGTQKGGTSALDAYLREHPRICMADEKEPHFFDDEECFAGAGPDYARYHLSFSPQDDGQLVGEATPIYMYWLDAPRRIRDYNPEIKLIVLLRNPIERAYSHWNMERSRGQEHLPFMEAVQREQERCRAALPLQHRVYSYLDRGFYMEQLRRIWRYFPEEQVLVLRSDELRSHPGATLGTVCDFLGIEPFGRVDEKTVNSRPYPLQMDASETSFLRSVYEREIRDIEQALGWDCGAWLGA